MIKQKIRVGSRESKLAVTQTRLVMDQIQQSHPEIELELITMKTTGDIILDRTLDKIGGKGLFVKELDNALREGKIDISVHSLKDMPMETPEDLPIVALSEREDPRDVLILPKGVVAFDGNSCIGCSSLRRIIQLQKIYGMIQTQSVRGNIITRLEKLDKKDPYGALVLAYAGLKRVGLQDRVSRIFEPNEIIPAAGQGILAIQGRKGEDYGFLDSVNNQSSQYMALAERGFVRYLDGGCSSPVAAYAALSAQTITVNGLYYDEATGRYITGSATGDVKDAEEIGINLAKRLRKTEMETE